jgi:hypothetical protein
MNRRQLRPFVRPHIPGKSVRRIFERAPTRNFSASVAAIEATRFTAEFKMPAVSQVSTVPRGDSGKMQARHAVSPGRMFMVTA